MRQQGCCQYEQITGGDCGQHGPLFIPSGTDDRVIVPDWKDAEIASLRAKVERLKFIEAAWTALKSELKYTPGGDLWPRAERVVELEQTVERLRRERDEALEALSAAQNDLRCGQHEGYKLVWCTGCIKIERQRAEAVVEAAKVISQWAESKEIPRKGLPFGALREAIAALDEVQE